VLLKGKSKFTSYRCGFSASSFHTQEGVYMVKQGYWHKIASSAELPGCWPFGVSKAKYGSGGKKINLVVIWSELFSF